MFCARALYALATEQLRSTPKVIYKRIPYRAYSTKYIASVYRCQKWWSIATWNWKVRGINYSRSPKATQWVIIHNNKYFIIWNFGYSRCYVQWSRYRKNIRVRAHGADKLLDWKLHFQRRRPCRNSIRPRNCERAFIQRHRGFPGTRPNFGRRTAKISPLSIERLARLRSPGRNRPHGRIATISMDLSSPVNSSFFFISPRMADTGLIIGNEETQLITRDSASVGAARNSDAVTICRKLRAFHLIKYQIIGRTCVTLFLA